MAGLLSLPTAPDEITPTWLTAALREADALQQGAVEAVDWEIIGQEQGFTGVVARIRPRYVDLAPQDSAPTSLIAKLPTAERGTPSTYRTNQQRDAAAIRRHVERCAREVLFYREIAPVSWPPVPRLYYGAADDESARVVLLLEDLAEARAGDALAGCTPDEAALVLEAIAPLHAHWWSRADPDHLPWLPRWGGDHHARQERYSRQVGPFLERFGHQLPPAVCEIAHRLRDSYAKVLAALDRLPAAVIHADLHLDNVLFLPADAAQPAVLIDWQSIARGPAVVDVALFLFGSLDPQRRREAEDQLLRLYHALLVEHGVREYAQEQLWDDCRLALLWQLAGTVGWLASANLDEVEGRERALMEAAIGNGRLIAALLDHDVPGLLSA